MSYDQFGTLLDMILDHLNAGETQVAHKIFLDLKETQPLFGEYLETLYLNDMDKMNEFMSLLEMDLIETI